MKSLFIRISLIFICLPSICWGQMKTVNSSIDFNNNVDGGISIYSLQEGYFILGVGSLINDPIIDAIEVAVVDDTGSVIIQKVLGEPYESWHPGSWGGAVKTSDNHFIVGGSYKDTVSYSQPLLLKLNDVGEIIWLKKKQFQLSTIIYKTIETHDGGYAFTGVTIDSNNNYDAYLLKTDGEGNTLWEKTWGGIHRDGGLSIQPTSDKGFLITGGTQPPNNSNGWITKTDSLGNPEWTKTYGTVRDDCGIIAEKTLDGGYIMSQCIDTLMHPGDFHLAEQLIKTDSLGKVQWRTFFQSWEVRVLYKVRQFPDSTYIAAGYISKSYSHRPRGWLAKVNRFGEKLWEKEYVIKENESNILTDFQPIEGGGIVATGIVNTNPVLNSDFWLLKLDQHGCLAENCDSIISNVLPTLTNEAEIAVFPNPVQDQLNIEWNGFFSGIGEVYLLDLSGRQLKKKTLNFSREGKIFWDVMDIPTGIYLIQVHSEGQPIFSQRIAIMR